MEMAMRNEEDEKRRKIAKQQAILREQLAEQTKKKEIEKE